MRRRRLQCVDGLEVESAGLSGVFGRVTEPPGHLIYLLSCVGFELISR